MVVDSRKWYQRPWIIVCLLGLCLLSFDLLLPLGLVGLVLMWRHARWPRPIKCLVTLTVPAPVYLLVLAIVASDTGVGGFSSMATLGQSCLNGPEQVASGPDGSIYVLDRDHLLRIASGGRVLWQRRASAQGGLASDARGNVYVNDPAFLAYKNLGSIQKISPQGRLLARWPANETTPALIDRKGTLYAVNTLDSYSTLVRRLSSTNGRLLGQWRSPIHGTLVSGPGGNLYALGSGFAQPDRIVQVAPLTGKVIHRWQLCHRCSSYDTLAADTHGVLYAGLTVDGDAPFAIASLTLNGSGLKLQTVNQAQELVGQLAFDSRGNIYVIRNSYSRAGPSNTGLDELSPSGSVTGTFQPCHPDL